LPAAYTAVHQVVVEEIDEYEHVNNTVYLQWLDRIAWAHSAKLGIPIERCLAIRCGMAVRHTRVDYLEAARLDDLLVLATWIVAGDDRLHDLEVAAGSLGTCSDHERIAAVIAEEGQRKGHVAVCAGTFDGDEVARTRSRGEPLHRVFTVLQALGRCSGRQ